MYLIDLIVFVFQLVFFGSIVASVVILYKTKPLSRYQNLVSMREAIQARRARINVIEAGDRGERSQVPGHSGAGGRARTARY